MNEALITDAEYFRRIMTILAIAVALFVFTAMIIGQERKAKWFKKRTKYTLFTRRGIFGEYINFGYPCTWEGALIFTGIFGFIFSFGYWYVFLY